jgi:NitT/TauT family transport system ATP-binding protein
MDLVVEGVGHSYGKVRALERIDLRVTAGEILALIGPSGCGKSTLIGIMGGILQPSEGRVVLEGARDGRSLNPFTYIFQDFALLPWRTVAGNVALALEHHGLSAVERRARVDAVLARTTLSEFADAFPRQLSGGMRQRVGIARALVVEPEILFMDEPLSALDAQTRELLMDDFLALWEGTRASAVYVTHNLAEAIRLADRVAVLSRRPGRLREVVSVSVPRAERGGAAFLAKTAELQEHLWRLIKKEALEAERERIDD